MVPMSSASRLKDIDVIDLQVIEDSRGVITVAEAQRHVPFVIERLFVVSSVAAGTSRGGHAHKAQTEFLICVTGSVEVRLDDGNQSRRLVLDKPDQGLLLPPLMWSTQVFQEPDSILAVLCDAPYDEADNLRDYAEFQAFIGGATIR